VNRKINSMPFYRLKEYIKYKALERGIAVIEVPEPDCRHQIINADVSKVKKY